MPRDLRQQHSLAGRADSRSDDVRWYLRDVIELIVGVEVRLERLLATGWRASTAERDELQGEAARLQALGLSNLARRITAVAEAESAAQGLARVAVALANCRLLETQLPSELRDASEANPRKRRAPAGAETAIPILLISRMAMGDAECWVGVRMRRGMASQLVLLDPPPGVAEASPAMDAPWLRAQIEAPLRWTGRYPLGATAVVDRCTLPADAAPNVPSDTDPLKALRAALIDATAASGPPTHQYGKLRLLSTETEQINSYAWVDADARAAFEQAAPHCPTALVWIEGATVAPLALVRPGGFLRSPALVHLVSGSSADTLEMLL